MTRTRTTRLGVSLALCAMVAAGCGGSDGTEAEEGNAPESEAPTEEVEASDDPTTSEPDEEPEASEASLAADGDPCTGLEPQPLDEVTPVRVARSAVIEAFAQVYLAESLGEFEAENLDIEYVDAGSQSDALVLLSSGDVDVLPSSPTAGFFNAVAGGNTVKMVAPIFIPPADSKAGMWLSTELLDGASPDDFDYSALAGTSVGVSGGPGSPASFVVFQLLQEAGLSFDDITVEQLGAADLLIALENGAIQSAYLNDPFWIEADKGDYAEFAVPQPSDVSLGATLFGPNLLEENREVGEAFIRAYARTTCEYLQGDYHSDPEVVTALAETIEVPEENITGSPSLNFDPTLTIPEGVTDTLQEIYGQQGSLTDPDVLLPEDEVVDRGFVEAVVGS